MLTPFTIANFLRINIYLTQKISEDMLWNIAINDAGAEYDPLTLLRTRTMFGRPDWKAIYGRMREAIETGQYIPGINAQLKTKVGVCAYSQGSTSYSLLHRPTSAVPASWLRLSRLLATPRPVRMLTSASPRSTSKHFPRCTLAHSYPFDFRFRSSMSVDVLYRCCITAIGMLYINIIGSLHAFESYSTRLYEHDGCCGEDGLPMRPSGSVGSSRPRD